MLGSDDAFESYGLLGATAVLVPEGEQTSERRSENQHDRSESYEGCFAT